MLHPAACDENKYCLNQLVKYNQAYIAWFISPRGYNGRNPDGKLSNKAKPIFLNALLQDVATGAMSVCICLKL